MPEKVLAYASPLDLYAAEIDLLSGRHLGNFPPAFTRLALINAVMQVIRADEDLAAAQEAFAAGGGPSPATSGKRRRGGAGR